MNGNNNINNHEGGGVRTNPRVFVRNNSQSQIPLPRFTTMTTLKMSNNNDATMSDISGGNNWKAMYDEAERKRKLLVTQSQRNAREYAELEKKHHQLREEDNMVLRQLQEKTSALAELRRVSEAMYKEYDQLKNKYEVETGALHEAMKSAHQWYKQNRVLKRQSTMLAQKFLSLSPGGAIDIDLSDPIDSVDSEEREGELEDLRRSVRNLSEEVGRLQSELNSARLEEFEAQEQAMNHATELETERLARKHAEAELGDLRSMRDNVNAVSHMVATELVALRSQCQQEQESAKAYKVQADKAQKERNVLAHQSSMLLGDINTDERIMMLVQEIENLKGALEEAQQRHATEVQELQNKLEEREIEAQLELTEEKLKLAESELQRALHRAERAETQAVQLSSTVSRLEVELIAKATPPPPPPPPPPPLPPPFPNLSMQPRQVPNAVVDMAKMLGIVHKQSAAVAQGGAINDIINQIKGGRFNLKTTDKQREKREQAPPPAVQEMLNILGTMKRRPKIAAAPADIAL